MYKVWINLLRHSIGAYQ